MAARGSGSSGLIILASALGVTTLGFFVTTVVFFANARAAEDRAQRAETIGSEYVTDQDRNNPVLQRLREEARSQRKSAVAYMLTQQEQLMRRTLGTPTGSVEALAKELAAIAPEAGEGSSAVSILRDQRQQLAALNTQLRDATAAKDRALADQENLAKLIGKLQEDQRTALERMATEVNQAKADAEKNRADVDQFKATMDERVDRIRSEFTGKETGLQSEIDRLQRDNVTLRARVGALNTDTAAPRFAGQSEYGLVDGTIVGINSADNTVVLGVGRNQRVPLGLTFEIYGDATAIRPDERSGNYPRGKASVEVIRVDADSSVARVLREQKGNPVVTGDVAANALYDPQKVYKFLVFGNFDPTGTGTPTPLGAADIKAKVTSWGGRVVDDLSGDVDFVVLGARPRVPPEPTATSPIEFINEYLRLREEARKYDDLFARATQSSIPVLNENRLYTLTGN